MLNSYLILGRFDRPIGITLLVLPCWWGLAAGQLGDFNLYLCLLFLIGATAMRAAGCALNDIFDRFYDRQVTRTKHRPLAAGDLTVPQALGFFILMSVIGLSVLVQLPMRCWGLGLVAFILLLIYPLMKRVTHWPQVVLGLAFNSGIFIAAAALAPLRELDWPFLLLCYAAGVLITVAYDTIYACQDCSEDQKLGLGSTAIKFGIYVKPIIIGCYLLSLLCLITAVYFASNSVVAYVILIFSHAFFIYKVVSLPISDSQKCQEFFLANQWILSLIFIAILLT